MISGLISAIHIVVLFGPALCIESRSPSVLSWRQRLVEQDLHSSPAGGKSARRLAAHLPPHRRAIVLGGERRLLCAGGSRVRTFTVHKEATGRVLGLRLEVQCEVFEKKEGVYSGRERCRWKFAFDFPSSDIHLDNAAVMCTCDEYLTGVRIVYGASKFDQAKLQQRCCHNDARSVLAERCVYAGYRYVGAPWPTELTVEPLHADGAEGSEADAASWVIQSLFVTAGHVNARLCPLRTALSANVTRGAKGGGCDQAVRSLAASCAGVRRHECGRKCFMHKKGRPFDWIEGDGELPQLHRNGLAAHLGPTDSLGAADVGERRVHMCADGHQVVAVYKFASDLRPAGDEGRTVKDYVIVARCAPLLRVSSCDCEWRVRCEDNAPDPQFPGVPYVAGVRSYFHWPTLRRRVELLCCRAEGLVPLSCVSRAAFGDDDTELAVQRARFTGRRLRGRQTQLAGAQLIADVESIYAPDGTLNLRAEVCDVAGADAGCSRPCCCRRGRPWEAVCYGNVADDFWATTTTSTTTSTTTTTTSSTSTTSTTPSPTTTEEEEEETDTTSDEATTSEPTTPTSTSTTPTTSAASTTTTTTSTSTPTTTPTTSTSTTTTASSTTAPPTTTTSTTSTTSTTTTTTSTTTATSSTRPSSALSTGPTSVATVPATAATQVSVFTGTPVPFSLLRFDPRRNELVLVDDFDQKKRTLPSARPTLANRLKGNVSETNGTEYSYEYVYYYYYDEDDEEAPVTSGDVDLSPTSPSDGGPSPLDLVVLLDDSASVGIHNFEATKRLVSSLADALLPANGSEPATGARLALATWSRRVDADSAHHLKDAQDAASVQAALGRQHYAAGTADNIFTALQWAGIELRANGRRGGRAKRAVLLFTDGRQTVGGYTPAAMARRLRERDAATVIAIAVSGGEGRRSGAQPDWDAVNEITGDDQRMVLRSASYETVVEATLERLLQLLDACRLCAPLLCTAEADCDPANFDL